MSNKKTIFITITYITGLLLIGFVWSSSDMQIQRKTKLLRHLFPQSWAFFTVDPLLERHYYYRIESEQLKALDLRNNVAATCFGLSRLHCVELLHEANELAHLIDEKDWQSLPSSIDSMRTIKIYNTSRINHLSGIYIIKKEKPMLWENRFDSINVTEKFVKVNIRSDE